MTLLTIVQEAAAEIGLPEPASVIDNNDNNVRTLLRMANKSGQILTREYDWTELIQEQTFTTTAAEAQVGAIPANFDHFVNGTIFNRTTDREVVGPLTPVDWAREKSSVSGLTVFDAFRLRGGDFLMTPTPTDSETIAFEYVSKYWVDAGANSTYDAEAYTTDADLCIFPERIMTLAVIWRFLAAKGLQYGQQQAVYSSETLKTIGRDGGAAVLPLAHRRGNLFPTNVQETGYGV